MKRIVFALIVILVLASCGSPVEPIQTDCPVTYDWMAGESLIPAQRTGIRRQGISTSGKFESTSDGVYFIYKEAGDFMSSGTWLLYGDNGSDTIIKLCGRPDCPHVDFDCNAKLNGATDICYYDGYLYANSGSMWTPNLVRMNPDGTDRITILSGSQLATSNGYSGMAQPIIGNGLFSFVLTKFDENGEQIGDAFFIKLDGSMEEPEPLGGGFPVYNGGESNMLILRTNAQYGGEYGGYAAWDPETNTTTYLTDHSGQPGYYGDEEAYYFRDGTAWRLDYATQQESVLFETGLEGDYKLNCYPDCIVIASREYGPDADRNLYIYNWAFELVEKVALDYPLDDAANLLIVGENEERIILSDGDWDLPRYYIEKSELGTGEAKIHEYKLPDLAEEIAIIDQQLADN